MVKIESVILEEALMFDYENMEAKDFIETLNEESNIIISQEEAETLVHIISKSRFPGVEANTIELCEEGYWHLHLLETDDNVGLLVATEIENFRELIKD